MAQLDETIDVDQAGHIDDHEKLAKKANYVFDVKDFGATGDGLTDDTAAIQAAIDATQPSSSVPMGGKVFFPAGEYRITDSLNLYRFQGILEGVGQGTSPAYSLGGNATVIRWDGDNLSPMLYLTDYMLVKVTNMRLEGNNTTPPTWAIESYYETTMQSGTNTQLVVEDVYIGRYTWSSQGTDQGNVVGGIGYTGQNGNNDEYRFNRVMIEGCETGISMLNSQTVAGSMNDITIGYASVVGVTLATTMIASAMFFNRCQIDVSLTGTGQSNIYGWYSENSGQILKTDNSTTHPVSVFGGWWILASTLGLGSGDYFVDVGLAGAYGGGISLYGVRIVNGTDSDLRARSYGATIEENHPGLVQLVSCTTSGFSRSNIIIDDAGGWNETLLVIQGCTEIPNMTKLIKDGGAIPTTPIHEFEGEAMIDGDLNHDGTNAGFYGTAPIAQQTGVAVDAAGIHAALVALGLITA